MKSQRPLRAWGMAARRLSINRGKKETLEMGNTVRFSAGVGIVSGEWIRFGLCCLMRNIAGV